VSHCARVGGAPVRGTRCAGGGGGRYMY
jgi:hypothetical protein